MRMIETNWQRLLNMYKSTGFCIISACRNDASPSENRKNSAELKRELLNYGFQPIKVSGGWIENKGMPDEAAVGEDSLFVPFYFGSRNFAASKYDYTSTRIFLKKCLDLGTKYGQESILYCPPNGSPKYIQTSEVDYGDGPIKIGTTTARFNKEKIGDNKAAYFTDISNPRKEGGYDPIEKRFRKSPKRVTFESQGISKYFRSIYENRRFLESENNFLDTEYIQDEESTELCYDYDAVVRLSSEYKDEWADFELKDINNFESLKEWWDANYDPKGLAFTFSYHESILKDVEDMIEAYNKICIQYDRPLLSKSKDVLENEHSAKITISFDEPIELEDIDEESFIDDLLYFYKGAPVKTANYSPEGVTLIWNKNALNN